MVEPKLRFKADDECQFPNWKKKQISDVFLLVKDKNKDGHNQNVITNSAEFGLINQRDFFDKDIAVNGKTDNYTIIKTGDFVYNPRKSKLAPYGPFNCYQLEDDGIVSPLYTCLRPKNNINKRYLLWYFQSGTWHRFIYENGAQNGARHDRVGMTNSLMQEIPVYLPQALEEQQKIADFLSTVDIVIEKQQKIVSEWEKRKKGVMQKLFSQEVRFKADDGSDFSDWEKKKLEDVVEFLDGKRKPLEAGKRIPGEYPYYGASGIIDHVKDYIFDEELILLSEDGANILDRNYRVCFLAKGKYWVNNHAHVLKASNGNINRFICEQLETLDYKKYNSGGAQPKLNQATCRGISINIPCYSEQQKIANCLSSLDDVIAKQKATLAAWEELKKGLLQQMFI